MIKEGQNAYFKTKGMWIQVKVLEIKRAYGRTRYRVTPTAGKGETTVEQLEYKILK